MLHFSTLNRSQTIQQSKFNVTLIRYLHITVQCKLYQIYLNSQLHNKIFNQSIKN